MTEPHQFGREAENQAAGYLLSLGYSMITRRFRIRGGEIDLICLDGDTIVFVEVKGRSAPGYRPEDSIGAHKLQLLQKTAHEFLKRMEENRNYRFDVVAIDSDGLRHHKHIFND
jgi:putative endonuclease